MQVVSSGLLLTDPGGKHVPAGTMFLIFYLFYPMEKHYDQQK